MAYEFCEDQATSGVLYFEVRFSPHLLCSDTNHDEMNGRPDDMLEKPNMLIEKPNMLIEKGISPRAVVQAVLRGLKRGEQDFGVKARSILCCMRHKPGRYIVM